MADDSLEIIARHLASIDNGQREVKTEMQKLQGEVQKLQADVEGIRGSLGSLEGTVSALRADHQALRMEVRAGFGRLNGLQNRVDVLERQ